MEKTSYRAIAVVGVGAILPDAPNALSFWNNIKRGRYSISDVDPKRWDPALYYDSDPKAPDKTYSKIGGWVREWEWDPMRWHLPIPPRVAEAMDDIQKWTIAATREALIDFGYPHSILDTERTAVIFGNAMAGEKHYYTVTRISFPEFAAELSASQSFSDLPSSVRKAILKDFHERIGQYYPEITEDTMPGELGNCLAGRIANIYNFHGPNYVVDAACASAMAAINAAVEGLVEGDYDSVVTGGLDRNMGASTYVKFSKIGALSATGTRPYADGADGFVMGEGAVIFILKRLADAERDGNKIYAVIRGLGGSSDGKGKGITAPNPVGQRLAVERAWANAGLPPSEAGYIEGHGTSTRVGDVVETQSIADVIGAYNVSKGSVALGSVKSNIGHLKAAAGAAGLLKTIFALHEKALPPSLNFARPNPNIDFANLPLYVNTELKEWPAPESGVRRAGVSAFGFGGTNFHAVLEEYIPGRLKADDKISISVPENAASRNKANEAHVEKPLSNSDLKSPLRGALLLGAESTESLIGRLRSVKQTAASGVAPPIEPPSQSDLSAKERIAIDYADAADLAEKIDKAIKAFEAENPMKWKALRSQGIFRGRGPAGKIAFLYPGQGSQYVNMLKQLCEKEPIVAGAFAEADKAMTGFIDGTLTGVIFVDSSDGSKIAQAEESLKQTAITQPAVLTADEALTRLIRAYGIIPDMVMGHSLGEYGALLAAGAIPFADALVAVSARGREMTRISIEDNGMMAAVFAPLTEIEKILKTIDGYVVIANINSYSQAVIGGAARAVEGAIKAFEEAGMQAVRLPVSHAFHTKIVAPAAEPLRRQLERLHLESPKLRIISNVTGDFYPIGENVKPQMLDLLAKQVASPVQFIKGLQTLYEAGARVFVEVGPKKALHGLVEDVLGEHEDVVAIFTNHPKVGDIASFNQALCGLYAAGHGAGKPAVKVAAETNADGVRNASACNKEIENKKSKQTGNVNSSASVQSTLHSADRSKNMSSSNSPNDHFIALGKLFADFIENGLKIHGGRVAATDQFPTVITGAGLGLPGVEQVFDDANLGRLLRGEQFIDVIPTRFRRAMADKHITRLVKSEEGGPRFETIDNPSEAIKLAARAGRLDLVKEFGIPEERVAALDHFTQLAVGAGIEALRDAGIPLVLHYKKTTKGTMLPDRWGLPESMRDDTGVIFASAFPGLDSFAETLTKYYADHSRREQLHRLEHLLSRLSGNGDEFIIREIEQQISELHAMIEKNPYSFDRRFLFRVLSMGHSQFAELIGARGPNTQINSACASTTQAVSLAEDWIKAGRCNRVVIVAADDVTTDNLMEWFGAGFLITGAAATDETVEDAALPFDRRRHGMLIGMGAASIVVESMKSAAERGLQPICEVLSTVTANSAFHGTRLDVNHISQMMEKLVAQAEERWGLQREQIAPQMVFISHETYTPARGGSASAEVHALRHVFGPLADQIVVANTKGFTGHPMGVGIEDVVAVKALETGIVPPVANFKEVDPELGRLNLSKGGAYPIQYALRLGAGFGSQISMTLMRWTPPADGAHRSPEELGYNYRIADSQAWRRWLVEVSGSDSPELEIVNRTLRLKDSKAAKSAASAAPKVQQPSTAAATTQSPQKQPVIEAAVIAESKTPQPSAAIKDEVKDRVLSIVSEKTGYPPDMLDMELDLEADLGIDTVKQAEVFASIREAYDIPREENLKLRDFSTIARAVQFVYDRRPDLAAKASTPEAVETAPSSVTAVVPVAVEEPVKKLVLSLVSEKTGYPIDMLDPDLDLEADLGVDTVKQAEIFAAIRSEYDIPREESLKLRDFPTLAHVVKFVYDRRPDLFPSALPEPQRKISIPESKPAEIQSSDDPIKDEVLAVVSEKTGYPIDMLDLDQDLEADLGIDTVKQADIFATVRGKYGIPRDENLKLRDFPTLAHVIKFAHDRQPASAETDKRSAEAPIEQTEIPAVKHYDLEAADSIPRRVPIPVLRPALEFCKPTGAAIDSTSRIVVMPDEGGAAEALIDLLKKKNATALILDRDADSQATAERISEWQKEGPIQGVYWLAALDHEGDVSSMNLEQWRKALHLRVKMLYAVMRALYEQISAKETFLISATRLGGKHGYDCDGAYAPMGGAVTGFVKAYSRERTDALVKAVDFESCADAETIAGRLIGETLNDNGSVEVGYGAGLRWSISLVERSAKDGMPGLKFDNESVFVVTGAAGSIVSAIISDLAASGGVFHLLDLAPKPDPNNSDLARFDSDKDGLKRDLFERIKAKGEKATPAMVERELAGLERMHAALSAIQAIEAAGGKAFYHSVNLLDSEAVQKAIDEVRESSGRIDALIHAAGMEISRFLSDKEPREFDLVFDVKSDGWFNLLKAIGDMPLSAAVAFSSIAGRFGNGGQTDYSSANDLLCKFASSFRTSRPETRAIAIDWSAWGEIGMASRGSIPKMMEIAGIDMIPPQAGIPIVRRELTVGAFTGEVLIAGRLGILMDEKDETGGVDPAALATQAHGPMIGEVKRAGIHDGLLVEVTLDPKEQPFLYDHQIGGTPVLPGVMGIEGFAETAKLMLPNWHVISIENVDFLAPFKFYKNEPRTLSFSAKFYDEGDSVIAQCSLLGIRQLSNQPTPQVVTHFTASVRLSQTQQEAMTLNAPDPSYKTKVSAEDVYKIYFHGPAYRVLESAWKNDEICGLMNSDLSPNHHPEELSTAIAPRLLELCFQTAGIWEMGVTGRMGLPAHIDKVSILISGAERADAKYYAAVEPNEEGGGFDGQVVDADGSVCITMAGYRTIALPNSVEEEQRKPLMAAMVGQ